MTPDPIDALADAMARAIPVRSTSTRVTVSVDLLLAAVPHASAALAEAAVLRLVHRGVLTALTTSPGRARAYAVRRT